VGGVIVTGLIVWVVSNAVECTRAYSLDGPWGCIRPLLVKEETEYAAGRGSRRWPSISTSARAGMTCVGTTLLVGAVLESAATLLSRGQLGVRFPYTAPFAFVWAVRFVVVPVGTLVGASGWLLARAVGHQRPGAAAQHG
jgi:hypothetical protein